MIRPPSQLAELPERLRALRAAAASPSYAEIARRVGQERLRRGDSGIVSRATVYDCFRDGRRRFDLSLVTAIVRALSTEPAEARSWEAALHALGLRVEASALVDVADELPPEDGVFIGRTRELARLSAASGAYWVHALGGTGKTTLARRAARAALATGNAAGVVMVDLRGHSVLGAPADPRAVVRSALRALGEKNTAIPAGAARRLLRERLRASRTMLLLDDAASLEQVEAIVPHTSGVAVIVTSRIVAERSDFETIALPSFAPYESLALLDAVAGRAVVQSDSAAADALLELTDHLPLAVGLVAARVAAHETWTLAEHLEHARDRREGLRLDEPVVRSLELTYQQLSETAARMLRALAPYPVRVLDRQSIGVLVDADSDEADRAIDELLRHSLVTRTSVGRLDMHELVRVYALDAAHETDPPSVRSSAADRLRRSVVDRAWAARRREEQAHRVHRRPPRHSLPAVTVAESDDFLSESLDLLLHVALRMPDEGVPSTINLISETIGDRLHIAGRLGDALILLRQALRVAQEREDEVGVQRALVDLGGALTLAGQAGEAEEVFAALDESAAGWEREAPLVHNSRLVNLIYQGRLDEALAAFQAGARAARAVDDLWREGLLWNNVALLHLRRGALGECRAALERSIEISAHFDDTAGAARGRVNLGRILLDLEDHEAAAETSRAAIVEMTALDHQPGIVIAQTNLGSALTGLARFDEAVETFESAIEAARASGMPQEDIWLGLGVALHGAGRLDEAGRALRQGIEHARLVGDPLVAAECRDALGDCARDAGDVDGARELWRQAEAAYEEVGAGDLEGVRGKLAGVKR